MANTSVKAAVNAALDQYNNFNGTAPMAFTDKWSTRANLTNYQTFFGDYLFPKLTATYVTRFAVSNRFWKFSKELPNIGQLVEEYVFADNLPIDMDISKPADLMLRRNYPEIASKIYGAPIQRKVKVTLSELWRRNFSTFGQATSYFAEAIMNMFDSIDIAEEREALAVFIDYFQNYVAPKTNGAVKTVTSFAEADMALMTMILNMRDPSDVFNEVGNGMMNNGLIRKTSRTQLDKIFIICSDEMAAYLINSKLANTFQVAGIDILDHVFSFMNLGGYWITTSAITISDQNTIDKMRAMGDYQTDMGDTIEAGKGFAYDVSALSEFAGNVKEITANNDPYFAMVWDGNSFLYRRYTADLKRPPFLNTEFLESNNWLHYATAKNIRPQFSKGLIMSASTTTPAP